MVGDGCIIPFSTACMVYVPGAIFPRKMLLSLLPNKKNFSVSLREVMIVPFGASSCTDTVLPVVTQGKTTSILTEQGGVVIVAPFTISVTNLSFFAL